MSKMLVPIILGSSVDKWWADKVVEELDKWGIPSKIHVVSAHKVPEILVDLINDYNKFEGLLCYVTMAGRSNGLSGCTSASAIHPVIACPPFSDKADMLVNLNSTLQMPKETPAITVLDPNNVANSIARMFGLGSGEMKTKVSEHVQKVKAGFSKDAL
ncbi:MAG: AIR carboxylase family protein [Candidatus Gracilibacteria bacterium]